MKRLVLACLLVVVVVRGAAAGSASGQVTNIAVSAANNGRVEFTVQNPQPASCNTNGKFAADLNTPAGRAMLAVRSRPRPPGGSLRSTAIHHVPAP